MTGYIGIGGTAKKIKNIYIGVGGTAKQVKKAYIGVGGVAKLWYSSQREWVWDVYEVNSGYNLIEGESESAGNTALYVGTNYTLNQNTGEFSVAQTTSIARSSTGATNAVGKYYINYTNTSGTYTGDTVYLITAASYNWMTGLSLTVTPYTSQYYENRGSLVGSVTDIDVTVYPINGIQNGYWYVLQYDYTLSYTGNYVESLAVVGDIYYRQIEFQSSGTLAIGKAVNANIWVCGGGGCGRTAIRTQATGTPTNGGAGAYAASANNVNLKDLVIVIGGGGTDDTAAGGVTSLAGDLSLTANGGNGGNTSTNKGCGGTGSGASRLYGSVGTGDGLSKIPFGDNSIAPYCDGGGAGGYLYIDGNDKKHTSTAGDGGTNGGNGLTTNSNPNPDSHNYPGGKGGGFYGGNGGDAHRWGSGSNYGYYTNGENAKGYGSGGGGGAWYYNGYQDSISKWSSGGSGGTGYQGVCFIRIPLE